MAGLVGYGSSDEEEDLASQSEAPKIATSHVASFVARTGIDGQSSKGEEIVSAKLESERTSATSNGPVLGPNIPGSTVQDEGNSDSPSVSAPLSPYTANRLAIQDLTLPLLPSFDIPPSPPGSPPPGTEKKFAHFLELKRQGVHFNEKLAQSTALKNPSLLKKLMDSAGLEEKDQYATALPEDLWAPLDLPEWAYVEELTKRQQNLKRLEEERRLGKREGGVEFVPASGSANMSANVSAESSRRGTPSQLGQSGKGGKSNAADRVMAGLQRDGSARSSGLGSLPRRSGNDRR
ncbi:hypothetical protein MMC25_002514 [Agyrium rufum]|nr:hypothetical protein [Agyrium rufum]